MNPLIKSRSDLENDFRALQRKFNRRKCLQNALCVWWFSATFSAFLCFGAYADVQRDHAFAASSIIAMIVSLPISACMYMLALIGGEYDGKKEKVEHLSLEGLGQRIAVLRCEVRQVAKASVWILFLPISLPVWIVARFLRWMDESKEYANVRGR